MAGMQWEVRDGRILLNGTVFNLKGANWFGFETNLHVAHGLWGATTMDKMLDFCKAHRFNALRIPVSLELALNPDAQIPPYQFQDAGCSSDRAYDALDLLFDKAAARGILIMLDMHNLDTNNGHDLWYSRCHSENDIVNGWCNLVQRYGSRPNLFGIDLLNEPHGTCTWGMGNPDTDWDQAAVRIVQEISRRHPSFDKLLLVEGVGAGGAPPAPNCPPGDPAHSKFWGSNFDGLYKGGLDFGSEALNKRLIYSPHIYGPGVAPQPYFDDTNFPHNMPEIWDKQIGFIAKLTGKAVVVGEWGGTNEGKDAVFQAKWSEYLRDRGLSDTFYWCLNPNSSDTKGLLLDDWLTGHEGRLQLAHTAQPLPSTFNGPITAGATNTFA